MLMLGTKISVVTDANGAQVVQPETPVIAPPPTIPVLQVIADLGNQITVMQQQMALIETSVNTLNDAGIDVSALITMLNDLVTAISSAIPAQKANPPVLGH